MDHGKLRLYIHHHTVSHRRILGQLLGVIPKFTGNLRQHLALLRYDLIFSAILCDDSRQLILRI